MNTSPIPIKSGPIGVFDSGIGGLTVVKEIINILPNEKIIYLGDTARVPYGNRSKEAIEKFALEMVNFLLKKKVKILVVACNTISATCLDAIKKKSPVPVIGVIEGTVEEAAKEAKTIGVIGTSATISSGVYTKTIKELNPQVIVYSQACPLFVPLAEEGLINYKATELIARKYLEKFKNKKIDTLILGCTHYPILKKIIQKTVGKKVKLIDSAKPTAKKLKQILIEKDLINKGKKQESEFYVTDAPERIYKIAIDFLGYNINLNLLTL